MSDETQIEPVKRVSRLQQIRIYLEGGTPEERLERMRLEAELRRRPATPLLRAVISLTTVFAFDCIALYILNISGSIDALVTYKAAALTISLAGNVAAFFILFHVFDRALRRYIQIFAAASFAVILFTFARYIGTTPQSTRAIDTIHEQRIDQLERENAELKQKVTQLEKAIEELRGKK